MTTGVTALTLILLHLILFYLCTIMSYNCCHCFREINGKSFAKCANCRLHLHFACLDMSEDEANLFLQLKSNNVKILCNRCNAELASLNKIMNTMESIKSSLETRLADIVKLIHTSGASPTSKEEIISESVERSFRSYNIILKNVPENSGRADVDMANNILEVIDNSVTVAPGNVFRLGKFKKGRPRLLKLRLKTVEMARLVMKKRNMLKGNENFKNVIVGTDKTPQQLRYLKDLNSELELRRNEGASNLTIKYVNNVPQIVDVPASSGNLN